MNVPHKIAAPVILPCSEPGSYKTGSLPETLTIHQITKVLGFAPNVADDSERVTASWSFTVEGVRCGIWDYRGDRWSVYDPKDVLPELFRPVKAVSKADHRAVFTGIEIDGCIEIEGCVERAAGRTPTFFGVYGRRALDQTGIATAEHLADFPTLDAARVWAGAFELPVVLPDFTTQGYRVSWEIDVEATSPREAAEKARSIQLRTDSSATVFSVIEHDGADLVQIDLLNDEEDEDDGCPHGDPECEQRNDQCHDECTTFAERDALGWPHEAA